MKKVFPAKRQEIRRLGREFRDTASNFETKVFRACRSKNMSKGEQRTLRRMSGASEPFSCLLASNSKARRRMVGRLRKPVTRRLTSGVDVLHVTILKKSWTTSDEKTVIDLTRVRNEARRVLRSFGKDWLATTEMQSFANLRHRRGGKVLDVHVHGLVWGAGIAKGAQKRAKAWSRRWKAACPGARAIVVQRATISEIDLCRLLRYPWLLPDRCKNLHKSKTGITRLTESPKTDRFIRYLRLFQILSLIPCEKLLFAEGEGVPIRAQAVEEVYDWLHDQVPRKKRAGEIEVVADFWRRFMPKIGGAAGQFFGDDNWQQPLRWNATAAETGKRARVFCEFTVDLFEDRRELDVDRARLRQLIARTGTWIGC